MSPEEPTFSCPAQLLNAALAAAQHGKMPPFTSEQLLQTLGLDGPTPDGLTLFDRLIGDEPGGISALRLQLALRDTIGLSNEHLTNPAQEAIMQALGGVVATQLRRGCRHTA